MKFSPAHDVPSARPPLLLALAAVLSPPLFAQTTSPSVAELPTVDIVGRTDSGAYHADEAAGAKTELPLRELPQSVRTVTRQAMDDLGATKLDDVLDYGGKAAETGKNVGDDFRDGKITLPVILSYRRGTAVERDFWRESIEGGQNDDTRLEKALGLISRYGALSETIQRAQHYGTIARDALAPLPETPWKDALNDVIDFCIARVN